jgi:hypothetical protein
VPVRGELVRGPGTLEIEILDADPRRVKRVRIYPRKPSTRAIERNLTRRSEATSRAAAPVLPPTEKGESTSVPAAAEQDSPHAQVTRK